MPPVETTRFPEEAHDRLASVDSSHFWFRSRNKLILDALERYFPGATSLLEVGCGNGVVLEAIRHRYPGMELVGADMSPEALRIAGDRVTGARMIRADAQALPFRDEFDVVCALDLLEHVDDDRVALRELAAATRPGGGIVVNVPQYRWLWSAADDFGGHRRRYTKSEIEGKMRDAGLTVVRSTAWMAVLLPVVALSRFRDRKAGASYDPQREFAIPRSVNRAFAVVLDLERSAIERGFTFPVGSSRLVVARKP